MLVSHTDRMLVTYTDRMLVTYTDRMLVSSVLRYNREKERICKCGEVQHRPVSQGICVWPTGRAYAGPQAAGVICMQAHRQGVM